MFVFFFFNDTATTEIYTLSLHDALPISVQVHTLSNERGPVRPTGSPPRKASSFAQVCLRHKDSRASAAAKSQTHRTAFLPPRRSSQIEIQVSTRPLCEPQSTFIRRSANRAAERGGSRRGKRET